MVLQRESPGGLEQNTNGVRPGLGGSMRGRGTAAFPSVTPRAVAMGHQLGVLVCLFQLHRGVIEKWKLCIFKV